MKKGTKVKCNYLGNEIYRVEFVYSNGMVDIKKGAVRFTVDKEDLIKV